MEIVGKRIQQIMFDTPKMLRPSPGVFKRVVEGRQIKDVDRRAKLLIFRLEGNVVFTTHLRLTGRLLYRRKGDLPDDYVHVTLCFSDGTELRFANSRKFGYMELLEDRRTEQAVRERYGPEPLDDLEKSQFYQILQSTRRKVKDVLMDQALIAGIGNIYANDALWLARVHPETVANKLSRGESDRLFSAISSILREALKRGGSSDQWYRQIHGEKGHYQDHFRVYSKKDEPCVRHPDTKIKYLKVSQRGTFYCPKCQVKR